MAETRSPAGSPGSTPGAMRRAAIAFVFITVLLDILALGIVIPVLPNLVTGFQGGDAGRGAEVYGLFGFVWALMQFLFSPLLGALSDRFGRRPVILASNLGLGLDYALMALAPSLGWLLAGRVVSGITSASISTAGAYIADVTPPERRAAGFGMLGAAFGLGFVLGPALGGVLGGVDPRLPFWVAGGLSLANWMYGVLILPESLPADRRTPRIVWGKANPLGALALLRTDPQLLAMAGIMLLYSLAHEVLPSTFVLYATHRYGWDGTVTGLTLAAVGVASLAVQGGLVRPVVARFGERRALVAGLGFGTLGFVVYGLAPTGVLFWAGIPLMALWGLTGPAVQSLMTRRVAASSQGRLQGAVNSLRSLTGMFGPVLFTFVFAAAIRPGGGLDLPGAPFLLAALILAAAAVFALRVTRGFGSQGPVTRRNAPGRPA